LLDADQLSWHTCSLLLFLEYAVMRLAIETRPRTPPRTLLSETGAEGTTGIDGGQYEGSKADANAE